MNITVQSYLGNLDFGVITCRELVPDAWQIVAYLGDALDELVAAARPAPAREAPIKKESAKKGSAKKAVKNVSVKKAVKRRA